MPRAVWDFGRHYRKFGNKPKSNFAGYILPLAKYPEQIAEMPLAHAEAVLRLRAIYSTSDRENAERLAKELLSDWKEVGYYQAVECLWVAMDRLLTFFEMPAEHWKHLRTTNAS